MANSRVGDNTRHSGDGVLEPLFTMAMAPLTLGDDGDDGDGGDALSPVRVRQEREREREREREKERRC